MSMLMHEYSIYKINIKKSILVVSSIAATIMSIVLFYYYSDVKLLLLLTGLIMLCVCWFLAKLIGKNDTAAWLSKNNFTIYIYSWPFQSVAMVICDKLDLAWPLTLVFMFSAGLLAPIIVLTIYKKMKLINNRFFDLVLGVK